MSKDTDIHSCSYFCHIPACIKAQRDELRAKNEAHQVVFSGLADALAYLHELTPDQLDALRKDAARYRWLRDTPGSYEVFGGSCVSSMDANVDAAIDAARGQP